MSRRPERSRFLTVTLVLVLIAACFVFPRLAYEVRLAAMELRYGGLFLLLLVGFIWILIKLGPRK